MTDDKVPDLLAALELSMLRVKAERQSEAIERRNQEIARLRQWKAEATEVIGTWDAVGAMVDDLPLGTSRSAGVAREIERLRSLVPPPGTWRITVHEDGTVKRVALEYYGHEHKPSQTTWLRGADHPPTADEVVLWRDVSADPEDGAR